MQTTALPGLRQQLGRKAVAALAGLALAAFSATAGAAELQVLSAGAIEPGLRAAAMAFERQGGPVVRITFQTAPELRKRMQADAPFDVVIAPPAAIAEFADAGKLGPARAQVGRVGMGVAVRLGAPLPDIGTAAALRQAILQADSLVFNRASTGLYLESLLKKDGSYAQVEAKSTRYPDGAAVMEHVIQGKGREIGFGAVTEILLYQKKGLVFVGPLPADVQNYTRYTAATLAAGAQQALAAQFTEFLSGPVGKPLFIAAGVTE
jgi:molybdate transport system substrate-binding protein